MHTNAEYGNMQYPMIITIQNRKELFLHAWTNL